MYFCPRHRSRKTLRDAARAGRLASTWQSPSHSLAGPTPRRVAATDKLRCGRVPRVSCIATRVDDVCNQATAASNGRLRLHFSSAELSLASSTQDECATATFYMRRHRLHYTSSSISSARCCAVSWFFFIFIFWSRGVVDYNPSAFYSKLSNRIVGLLLRILNSVHRRTFQVQCNIVNRLIKEIYFVPWNYCTSETRQTGS